MADKRIITVIERCAGTWAQKQYEKEGGKVGVPAISVIVPVYNTPISYFHECMASVLAQSFTDYEVWLVDDGSTNGVEKICDEYAQKDERFKVIHQKNQGVSAARNAGTRKALENAAKGEYLIYLDPDDWWEKDTLKLIYQKAICEDLDIVLFSICIEFENRKLEIRAFPEEPIGSFRVASPDLVRKMQLALLDGKVHLQIPICCGSACNLFMRKRLIRENELEFDESLHFFEDKFYCLKLWDKAKRIGIWDMLFYHYRQHEQSACYKYIPEMTAWLDATNKKIWEYITESKNDVDFVGEYDLWLIGTYFRSWNNINSVDNPQTLKERKGKWETLPEKYTSFQRLYYAKFERGQIIKRAMRLTGIQLRSWELTYIVVWADRVQGSLRELYYKMKRSHNDTADTY